MVEHKIEAKTWRRIPLLGLIFVATMLWSAAAWAQEPIKIGFSVSLTGGLASSGKAHLLSNQIWAEEINAKGGLLGRPARLVHYDDQTKLIDVDKVDLLMGAATSSANGPTRGRSWCSSRASRVPASSSS
jgi:branched-chain amino acid transport system substrate-binding protein